MIMIVSRHHAYFQVVVTIFCLTTHAIALKATVEKIAVSSVHVVMMATTVTGISVETHARQTLASQPIQSAARMASTTTPASVDEGMVARTVNETSVETLVNLIHVSLLTHTTAWMVSLTTPVTAD